VGTGGIADYPATANWQKAIGGHVIWGSADVTCAPSESQAARIEGDAAAEQKALTSADAAKAQEDVVAKPRSQGKGQA
jgi:hypothetical protein